MKRKVNRTKRAKIGSHGFKVYKNTYVYIGKATESKQAVSEEIVETIQEMWNNNPSTKKMRKFIKGITIKRHTAPKHGGRWDPKKFWYEHIQCGNGDSVDVEWNKATFIHEVEGHAFWDFARKWRREDVIKFNEIANAMPPVNEYCKKNEKEWRKYNDEKWNPINGKEVHPSMTRYANEQHSAIAEIIRGVPSSRPICMSEENIEIMKKAWEEMHW